MEVSDELVEIFKKIYFPYPKSQHESIRAALEAVFDHVGDTDEKVDLRPLSERLLDAVPNVYEEQEDNQEGWIEWNKKAFILDMEFQQRSGKVFEHHPGIYVHLAHLDPESDPVTHYRIKPNTIKPDTYTFNYSAKSLDMKLEIKYSDGTSERFPLHHEQYTVKSGVDVVSYGIVTESVKPEKKETSGWCKMAVPEKRTLWNWIENHSSLGTRSGYILSEREVWILELISEYLERK